ncbi:hypothetical protein AYY20_04840 [Photobacterium aquimaris]|nr:hypothetical protein [Photobacterium aquimaris]OBU19288.1 hypothetical protein AYY20_04840 [Photobacterium aquimaris]
MLHNIIPFQRNKLLEYSIDKKSMIKDIFPTNLVIFLDVIDEMIDEYNNCNDDISIKKISNFLNNNKIRLNKNNFFSYSKEENDYIECFLAYIKDLRLKISGKSYNRNELIIFLFEEFTKISQKNITIKEQVNSIYTILCRFKNLGGSIVTQKNNILIQIKKYNYHIIIVNNIDYLTPPNDNFSFSLILNYELFEAYDAISKCNNIDYISYKNADDSFNSIYISSILDVCIQKISSLIYKLYLNKEKPITEEFKKILLSIENKINNILCCFNERPRKIELLQSEDIKLLRRKVISILCLFNEYDKNYNNLVSEIKSIELCLSILYNKKYERINLEQNILFSVSEIKRNNTLYIISKSNKKNKDFSFGEENLTSILASNLRCIYKENKNIHVTCEAVVGNGRSDVHINLGSKTLGIIEAKLLADNSNVEKQTKNAIDQLYSRYSENQTIEGDKNIDLYLILFAYDKNFNNMITSIKNAIYNYSKKNNLEYEDIDRTENGVKFLYKDTREEHGFRNKERMIHLMVCNMEIDYKSKSADRTKS